MADEQTVTAEEAARAQNLIVPTPTPQSDTAVQPTAVAQPLAVPTPTPQSDTSVQPTVTPTPTPTPSPTPTSTPTPTPAPATTTTTTTTTTTPAPTPAPSPKPTPAPAKPDETISPGSDADQSVSAEEEQRHKTFQDLTKQVEDRARSTPGYGIAQNVDEQPSTAEHARYIQELATNKKKAPMDLYVENPDAYDPQDILAAQKTYNANYDAMSPADKALFLFHQLPLSTHNAERWLQQVGNVVSSTATGTVGLGADVLTAANVGPITQKNVPVTGTTASQDAQRKLILAERDAKVAAGRVAGVDNFAAADAEARQKLYALQGMTFPTDEAEKTKVAETGRQMAIRELATAAPHAAASLTQLATGLFNTIQNVDRALMPGPIKDILLKPVENWTRDDAFKVQAEAAKHGIFLPSGMDSRDMTDHEFLQNLQIRKQQRQQMANLSGGDVEKSKDPLSQLATGVVKATAGPGGVITPAEAEKVGVPFHAETTEAGSNILQMLIMHSILGKLGAEGVLNDAIDTGATRTAKALDATATGIDKGGEKLVNLANKVKLLKTGDAWLAAQGIDHVVKPAMQAMIGHPVGLTDLLTATYAGAKGGLLVGKAGPLIFAPAFRQGARFFTNIAADSAADGGIVASLVKPALRSTIMGGVYGGVQGGWSPEAVASGAAVGLAYGLPELAGRGAGAAWSGLVDRNFVRGKYGPDAKPFDYGTNFDAAHNTTLNGLAAKDQTQVNNVRANMKGRAEIYTVDPQTFAAQANASANPAQANARGMTLIPDPKVGGLPRVFIRDNAVGDALHHELGHVWAEQLPASMRTEAIDAVKKINDVDGYTRDYVRRFTNGKVGNATYDSLPDTKSDPSIAGGLTKDDIHQELLADSFERLFNGQSLDQLARRRGLTSVPRGLRTMFGNVLERLGIPGQTAASIGIQGLKPSYVTTLMLENWIRGELKKQPAPTAAQPPPQTGAAGAPVQPPRRGAPPPAAAPPPTTGPPGRPAGMRQTAIQTLTALGVKPQHATGYVDGAAGNTAEEITANALANRAADLAGSPRQPHRQVQPVAATTQSPPAQTTPPTQTTPPGPLGPMPTQPPPPATPPITPPAAEERRAPPPESPPGERPVTEPPAAPVERPPAQTEVEIKARREARYKTSNNSYNYPDAAAVDTHGINRNVWANVMAEEGPEFGKDGSHDSVFGLWADKPVEGEAYRIAQKYGAHSIEAYNAVVDAWTRLFLQQSKPWELSSPGMQELVIADSQHQGGQFARRIIDQMGGADAINKMNPGDAIAQYSELRKRGWPGNNRPFANGATDRVTRERGWALQHANDVGSGGTPLEDWKAPADVVRGPDEPSRYRSPHSERLPEAERTPLPEQPAATADQRIVDALKKQGATDAEANAAVTGARGTTHEDRLIDALSQLSTETRPAEVLGPGPVPTRGGQPLPTELARTGINPVGQDQLAQMRQSIEAANPPKTLRGGGTEAPGDYEARINNLFMRAAAAEHFNRLPANDDRVTLRQNPLTDQQGIWGNRFLSGDQLHEAILNQAGGDLIRQRVAHIQPYLDTGQVLSHVQRGASSEETSGLPTHATRAEEYAAETAPERMKRAGLGQLQQHYTIPTGYMYHPASKTLQMTGFSVERTLANAHKLINRLRTKGVDVGYTGANDPNLRTDLQKLVTNHTHGWRGDGSAPITGTEHTPVQPTPGFDPTHFGTRIDPNKAAFLNAILNERSGRTDVPTGRGKKAVERSEALARVNADSEQPSDPRIREEARQAWADKELEAPYSNFNVPLMEEIGARGREELRGEATRGTAPETFGPGTPERPFVRARMMPAAEEPEQRLGRLPIGRFMPGESMVSPNVERQTTLERAQEHLRSSAHENALRFYQRVEDAAGTGGKVRSALGYYDGYYEGSTLTDRPKGNENAQKAADALKGLHSAQEYTLSFNRKADGPDTMHVLRFEKSSPTDIFDLARKHDYIGATVIPNADGSHDLHLLDENQTPETQRANENRFRQLLREAAGDVSAQGRTSGQVIAQGAPSGEAPRTGSAQRFRGILKEALQGEGDQMARAIGINSDLGRAASANFERLRQASGQGARFMPAEEHIDPERVVKGRAQDELHWAPTADVDQRWAASPYNRDFYLPRGATENAIGERYRRALEHLGGTQRMDAPEVSIWPDGTAHFADGRHTFAAMRDAGHTQVPLSLDPESVQNAKDVGLIPAEGQPQPVGRFMPAEAKGESQLRAPEELRVPTPGRQAQIDHVQKTAQQFLADNPAPERSSVGYLTGDKALPAKKLTVENLARVFNRENSQLDLSKDKNRQIAADALKHEVMNALSQNGNAVGWYDTEVDAAMDQLKRIDPSIGTNKVNDLMLKLSLAVTSQGQKVHPNFESGWNAFSHFKENGVLPTDRKVFGGGKNAPAMEQNFQKINDLREKLGHEDFHKMLETKITVRDLAKELGIKVPGEAQDFSMEGAMALGPKIGSFFNNLNKRFNTLTADLWASRSLNRVAGRMFKFSPKAFRTQVDALETGLKDGSIKVSKSDRADLQDDIDRIQNIPQGKLTYAQAAKAQAIADWADQTHRAYSKPLVKGGPTYAERTPANKLAKNIDLNLTQTSDAPRNSKERANWRDVFSKIQEGLRKEGIDMTVADLQAVMWYHEKNLYGRAGAASIGAAPYSYLDAAHSLVQRVLGEQANAPGRTQSPVPPTPPAMIRKPRLGPLPAGAEAALPPLRLPGSRARTSRAVPVS